MVCFFYEKHENDAIHYFGSGKYYHNQEGKVGRDVASSKDPHPVPSPRRAQSFVRYVCKAVTCHRSLLSLMLPFVSYLMDVQATNDALHSERD